MYATLGTFSLLAALAFALLGVLGSATGAAFRHDRLEALGRRASVPVFMLTLLPLLALWGALLINDTSVSYVATKSASDSPTWVKIVTLWSALQGSILLWAFLTTVYALILARVATPGPLRARALAVMYAISAFFLITILLAANPFLPLANPPVDGPGPNALLQNHWLMAVHPVLMYLGLVGLAIAVSGGYKAEREFNLDLGETKTILGRPVTYTRLERHTLPDKQSVVAQLSVRDREQLPRLNFYRSQQAPIVTPDIHYGLWDDTYVTLTAFEPQGRWVSLRLIVTPLVSWIWLGGGLLLIGTLQTLGPAWQARPEARANSLEAA